jgi:hypothetical protein
MMERNDMIQCREARCLAQPHEPDHGWQEAHREGHVVADPVLVTTEEMHMSKCVLPVDLDELEAAFEDHGFETATTWTCRRGMCWP